MFSLFSYNKVFFDDSHPVKIKKNNTLHLYKRENGILNEYVFIDRNNNGILDFKEDSPYFWKKVDIDGDGKTNDTDNSLLLLDYDGDKQIEHRVRTWDNDNDGFADYEIMFPTWDRDNSKWLYKSVREHVLSTNKPPQWHLQIDLDNDQNFNYDKIPFEDSSHKKLYDIPPWGSFPWLSDYYTDPEDVDGDNLHSHRSVEDIKDLRYGYETHRFYDLDDDNLTESHIRFGSEYNGMIKTFRWDFDLDNDNSYRKPRDWDFSFSGLSKKGINQSDYGYEIPHDKSINWLVNQDWDSVSLTWKEGGDSSRWEGMFGFFVYVNSLENIEVMQRDVRMEVDEDNSGKMKFYLSDLDGKYHLFGAEKGKNSVTGEWYFDTNNNGFFDTIKENRSSPTIKSLDNDKSKVFDFFEILPDEYDFQNYLINRSNDVDVIEMDGETSQNKLFLNLEGHLKVNKPLHGYEIWFTANDKVDYNLLDRVKLENGKKNYEVNSKVSNFQFIYPGETKIKMRLVDETGKRVLEKEIGVAKTKYPIDNFLELSNFRTISGRRVYTTENQNINLSYGEKLNIPNIDIWSIQPEDREIFVEVSLEEVDGEEDYRIYKKNIDSGIGHQKISLDLGEIKNSNYPKRITKNTLGIPSRKRYFIIIKIKDNHENILDWKKLSVRKYKPLLLEIKK